MRILIGPPLKQPPTFPAPEESIQPMFSSESMEYVSSHHDHDIGSILEEKRLCPVGLNGFVIYCTSDFITVSKKVHMRTRRVRLLGLEGAGKTSLLKAISDQDRHRNKVKFENIHPEVDTQEAIVGGVCYLDSTGVDLQELQLESTRFRDELQAGAVDLNKKTDLVVLVHNLSHKIPRYYQSNISQQQPALSILLNEAKALNVPWLLAITNKFSVSAHQQKMLIKYAMEAYDSSPGTTEVVNSCPFVMPTDASSLQSQSSIYENLSRKEITQRMFQAPLSLARMPFKRKTLVMPVQGVTAFRKLVHRVLKSQEEKAFQELANERLAIELAKEEERASSASQDSQGKGSSVTAAAVGASLGAGLGLVLAVVMGAASALRKP
ncbi:uncharacterized protein A4U43_C09F16560 [Asparagus officinalis]|uniref:Uncharacterized protein n=2 Tax=Asparagus officinalis TaxID=4686 RepID=A0A5P1E8H5_ASPOF|nr:uncharacterized protein A4U43_C09F16560 [Asparagus officinalis]